MAVNTYTSGSCTVTLDTDSGVMNITGNGAMQNYTTTASGMPPWWKTLRSTVRSVVVGEGVTRIGNESFTQCDNLAEVSLPSTLTSIGESAFSQCSSLAYIDIPVGVTSIEDRAFSKCGLLSVRLPASVTTLGNSVFSSNTNMASAYIGNVTGINLSDTFSYCGNLDHVSVSDSNTGYTSKDGVVFTKDGKTLVYFPLGRRGAPYNVPAGVTAIGNNAFKNCTEVTDVAFPEDLISIGNNAFDSSGLRSVTIPGTVTSIGEYAFQFCYELTRVVISDGVTTIEGSAFKYCPKLSALSIGNTVQTIGNLAFYYGAMVRVTIPASVTSIGSDVFDDCLNLAEIEVLAENPPALSDADCLVTRINAGTLKTIYVPAGSVDTYKADSVWGLVASIIRPAPNYADTRVLTEGGLVTVRPRVARRAYMDGDGNEISVTYLKAVDLPPVPTGLSDLAEDEEHRLVTDVDKTYWDSKLDASAVSDMETATHASATYQPKGDYALKSDVASVYRVKGSSVYAELPDDAEVGDVYNISDSATVPAGSNVVWTGEAWDKLSETLDLTVFQTSADLDTDVSALGYIKEAPAPDLTPYQEKDSLDTDVSALGYVKTSITTTVSDTQPEGMTTGSIWYDTSESD